MLAGNRKLFLSVTALIEAATGLCLFVLPAVLFAILLGLDHASDRNIRRPPRGRSAACRRRRKLESESRWANPSTTRLADRHSCLQSTSSNFVWQLVPSAKSCEERSRWTFQ